MSDEKRGQFFAKVIAAGGSAVTGLACLFGGLSAAQIERGFDAVLVLVIGVGLSALLLRTAWKIAGD